MIGARRQLVALLIEAGDFESARNVLTAGIAASPRNYQLYQDSRDGRPEVDRDRRRAWRPPTVC